MRILKTKIKTALNKPALYLLCYLVNFLMLQLVQQQPLIQDNDLGLAASLVFGSLAGVMHSFIRGNIEVTKNKKLSKS